MIDIKARNIKSRALVKLEKDGSRVAWTKLLNMGIVPLAVVLLGFARFLIRYMTTRPGSA